MTDDRDGPFIQMVISDFGGVLTSPLTDAFAAVQAGAGIPLRTLGKGLASATEETGRNPLSELECGRITEVEFQEQLADAIEPLIGRRPDVGSFGERLFAALDPNPEMIDLIREVRRRGFRAALLTNNVREWESAWRSMLPVDELFETVVDSAFVGVRKPEPEIYHLTLQRIGLDPGACIFIDDMEINCEAAADLGIHAVHFRETAQARREVHRLLEDHGGGR